ncbi:MAG: SDR family NAD(P)-dependent oxidoreductase, partial [Pseudomonadota bacterium]
MTHRVLITGGASGIGRRFAERFAETGARIAVCDADAQAAEELSVAHPEILTRTTDVTNEAQMQAFLDEVEAAWGGVDVVCANAGTGGPAGRIE